MNASLPTSERLLACPADLAGLARLMGDVRHHPRNADIIEQGQRLQHGLVLVDGWAMRTRLLADGRRQVISFLLPYDLIAAPALADDVADHSVVAITACRVAACPVKDLLDLCSGESQLHAVFAWMSDHDAAVLKEHIVALGQRDARERVCWLLSELWQRLRMIGLAETEMRIPLSRTMMAEALGLSVRHLTRVLQELDGEGVAQFNHQHCRVLDPRRLSEIAQADGECLRFGATARLVKSRLRQALAG